ncbi:MAG: hypothetical protein NTY01_23240 [Verrucomicrobia bacterium]|nr:hypothetical protein [Verrucomicrobiota bacterium]
MTATDIIHQIESLPREDQARVAAWLADELRKTREEALRRLSGCWSKDEAAAVEGLIEERFERIEDV